MTNFEKIKSFTIEQMGKFLNMVDLEGIDYKKAFCNSCNGNKLCKNCFIEWLNSDTKRSDGLDNYEW